MGGVFDLLLAFAALCIASSAMILIDSEDGSLMEDDDDAIETNICIIGGGASGTYTAVRLHEFARKPILSSAKMSWAATQTPYRPADEPNGRLWRGGFSDSASCGGILPTPGGPTTRSLRQRQEMSLAWNSKSRPDCVRLLTTGPSWSGTLARYGQQVAKYPALEYGFYLPTYSTTAHLVCNEVLRPQHATEFCWRWILFHKQSEQPWRYLWERSEGAPTECITPEWSRLNESKRL